MSENIKVKHPHCGCIQAGRNPCSCERIIEVEDSTPAGCGCHIVSIDPAIDEKTGEVVKIDPGPYILFCPLHHNAGLLLVALKEQHAEIKKRMPHNSCNVCKLIAQASRRDDPENHCHFTLDATT